MDFTKFEVLLARGYFGMGGGLFWRGAILDGKSLTVSMVCSVSVKFLTEKIISCGFVSNH